MRKDVGCGTADMKATRSSGNVFADLGFSDAEAEELAVKSDLITLVIRAIRLRKLTQRDAARICGTDQPTLSKVLSGRLESVTIDRLARWLVALGGQITINVSQPKPGAASRKGSMSVRAG